MEWVFIHKAPLSLLKYTSYYDFEQFKNIFKVWNERWRCLAKLQSMSADEHQRQILVWVALSNNVILYTHESQEFLLAFFSH